jgi:hypothetical protein
MKRDYRRSGRGRKRSSLAQQLRQRGNVRRDPPCLVAGQTDSSPKRYDAAIMSAIGGKAEVRDLRLKRRS